MNRLRLLAVRRQYASAIRESGSNWRILGSPDLLVETLGSLKIVFTNFFPLDLPQGPGGVIALPELFLHRLAQLLVCDVHRKVGTATGNRRHNSARWRAANQLIGDAVRVTFWVGEPRLFMRGHLTGFRRINFGASGSGQSEPQARTGTWPRNERGLVREDELSPNLRPPGRSGYVWQPFGTHSRDRPRSSARPPRSNNDPDQLRTPRFLAITKGRRSLVGHDRARTRTLLRRVIVHVIDPIHAARWDWSRA